MSAVTYGELYNGALKSQYSEVALQKLAGLVELIPVVPLATSVGQQYGNIRSALERLGTPIGNNDLWIAAHTLDLGLTLVTNNVHEFERIPTLRLENWAEPNERKGGY